MSSSFVCAVLLCAVVSARSEDNSAQAAARAALMQKMQDMDANNNNDAVPAPPPVDTQPAPAPAPAPEPISSSSEPTPLPVQVTTPARSNTGSVPANTHAAQEAARAALLMKMQELDSTEPLMQQAANGGTPPPAPETNVINQGFVDAQPFPTTPHSAKVIKHKGGVRPSPVEVGFSPLQAPPSPVGPEKEAELRALLYRYKTDQISAEQYQAERASIVGMR